MNSVEKMIEESLKADEVYAQLNATNSMIEVAGIIESLDENIAKIVLKKFVYLK